MQAARAAVRAQYARINIPLSHDLLNVITNELVKKYCVQADAASPSELEAIKKDLSSRPIGNPSPFVNVCVMGGGAFGTAMATTLGRRGHAVRILMLKEEQEHVESINQHHKNTFCFPNVILPSHITATIDPKVATEETGLIVHAVPVQFSRVYLRNIKAFLPSHVPILSVSKGISVDTLDFMDDIFRQELGANFPTAFIAGPSFAIGVIEGKPTWCTLASEDHQVAWRVQQLISSSTFRTYTTTDVRGVEICSALKNVLSILCGMSLALGLGPNTTNGLLTRGWADLRRLVLGLGGRSESLTGLSGMGDLMLTCYGGLSRNAKFGELLAKGKSVNEALEGAGGIVEGLPTAKAITRLAERLQMEIPVLNGISLLLEGKISAKDLVTYIITLPFEDEFPVATHSKL